MKCRDPFAQYPAAFALWRSKIHQVCCPPIQFRTRHIVPELSFPCAEIKFGQTGIKTD
ncbi:hypothetical protein AOE01nite_17370 [Acetobacter oeni]|uniref:Uncharacterized protein n=1 Tax=Acetobacter oeni TaxID=304077 RepID=A0A511XKP4_9PROT|nr:hypothetical protein AOE01nite_17370 [Acetobacter oeni]